MDKKLEYLNQNPVEVGFLTHAEVWQYSSAAAYAGERKNFIELLYVEWNDIESEKLWEW